MNLLSNLLSKLHAVVHSGSLGTISDYRHVPFSAAERSAAPPPSADSMSHGMPYTVKRIATQKFCCVKICKDWSREKINGTVDYPIDWGSMGKLDCSKKHTTRGHFLSLSCFDSSLTFSNKNCKSFSWSSKLTYEKKRKSAVENSLQLIVMTLRGTTTRGFGSSRDAFLEKASFSCEN